jgi:hypothetical protein
VTAGGAERQRPHHRQPGHGGEIDARLSGSADVTLYALGDGARANLRLHDASDLTVLSGLCFRGMAPAPLHAVGGWDQLVILTCQ